MQYAYKRMQLPTIGEKGPPLQIWPPPGCQPGVWLK